MLAVGIEDKIIKGKTRGLHEVVTPHMSRVRMWLGICILSSLRNNNSTRKVVPILNLDQRREARSATGQQLLLGDTPHPRPPITASWFASMNDTAQILDVSAISRTLSEQLAYISSNPPRAGSFIYLLPPPFPFSSRR